MAEGKADLLSGGTRPGKLGCKHLPGRVYRGWGYTETYRNLYSKTLAEERPHRDKVIG